MKRYKYILLTVLFILLISLTTYVFGMSSYELEKYIGKEVTLVVCDVNQNFQLNLYRGKIIDIITFQVDSNYLGSKEESFVILQRRIDSHIIPCERILRVKIGN